MGITKRHNSRLVHGEVWVTRKCFCCAENTYDFFFRYFFQLVNALNGSFIFVLALQFNEVVQREINEDNGLTVYDIKEHAKRIGILALAIVTISLLKEGMLHCKEKTIKKIDKYDEKILEYMKMHAAGTGGRDDHDDIVHSQLQQHELAPLLHTSMAKPNLPAHNF